LRAQVADDPRAVGDAEVPELRRRHDVDLDPAAAHGVHRVGDEVPSRIARRSRIRRGQDDDAHLFSFHHDGSAGGRADLLGA
jgi:hypothetical protein